MYQHVAGDATEQRQQHHKLPNAPFTGFLMPYSVHTAAIRGSPDFLLVVVSAFLCWIVASTDTYERYSK